MSDVGFEIGWQIDDIDCTEWALLRADTASNTQCLGDESDLGLRGDFDAETSTSHNRARFLALLSAFLKQYQHVGADYGRTSSLPSACTV